MERLPALARERRGPEEADRPTRIDTLEVNVPQECAHRLLALIGVTAPSMAMGFDGGIAVLAVPGAVAGLNWITRYAWPATSFLPTSTIDFLALSEAAGILLVNCDPYVREWIARLNIQDSCHRSVRVAGSYTSHL